MKKTFAVVLSGCGVYDGSEIGEAMMTLLAIEEAGCTYRMFAPDKKQARVMNHLNGQQQSGEERNVLTESARIARGNVEDLKTYDPADFDGLIFPGGFGAATNLSTFAMEGAGMQVDADVEAAVRKTLAAGKPSFDSRGKIDGRPRQGYQRGLDGHGGLSGGCVRSGSGL